MTGATGIEGAPILCKRCGAPSDVLPDASLRCRFCGTPDRLPPDELGRVLEIRGRLAMAASRVAQLASSEATLASVFERRGAFVTVMGPWPIVALLVVAYAAYGAFATLSALPASVPDSARVDILVAAAYGPFFVLGLTLSFPIALAVGRASYRRRVRPLLAARPPQFPGAPMRCRACGAGLPPSREAFVACAYCRTANVATAGVAAGAARQLDEELAGYRARASGALSGTSTAATHMTRTLVVCFVLVYAGVILLGAVGRAAAAAFS